MLHLLGLGDVVPLDQHCWRTVHWVLQSQRTHVMACIGSMQRQHALAALRHAVTEQQEAVTAGSDSIQAQSATTGRRNDVAVHFEGIWQPCCKSS